MASLAWVPRNPSILRNGFRNPSNSVALLTLVSQKKDRCVELNSDLGELVCIHLLAFVLVQTMKEQGAKDFEVKRSL